LLADTELARRCESGDDEAWTLLVEQYKKRVWHVAFQFTGRADEAEELTQEIFLHLLGALKSFDSSGSLPAWIQREGSFDALRAVTADGSIRITSHGAHELTSNWTIRTSDGPIELTLPASISAQIEATAFARRVVNDLSTFEGKERHGRLKGTLGKGGPLILVTTMDGRITLKES